MDEDSFADPEMGFGEEELTMEPLQPLVHDVEIEAAPEPATLASDANVPLDVEPDPDLGSTVEFTDQSPVLDRTESKPEIDAAESDELQLELQSLRVEIQGLQEERAALLEKNRDLQEQLEAAAPAGELSRLQGQLNEAKKHHAEAEEENRRLKGELAQAQEKVEKLELESAMSSAEIPDDTKRELDLMDAQIKALQTENTQLKEALKEAQGAESRTEHAHDELHRRVQQLEGELRDLREELADGAKRLDERIRENEELGRELAVARKELADNRDAADEVERKARELDDRRAELDAVTLALAEAKAEIERLAPMEAEVKRVENLEDRITDLQEALVGKEKDLAEVQEKLDSEAARSYRLAQRRIPALNAELEQSQESQRELERKLQKAELRANTFEEQAKELETKLADLQRALQGAKARAQDTAIVQAGDVDARQLVSDEVRRLTNRLRDVEEERGRLLDSLRRIGDAHKAELALHSDRAEKLELEADQRYENLLKQRTQMRVLRERITGMLKLAEDLNATASGQRQPLLEALRKLADVPPDTN
ncbi:MAG: hypothetical protein H6841_07685 [Planctomycetes bacterium]|nr:hypothetical protein [Planctomycetota bacterium]MCB9935239.1 hypothetical protein [Planctomycetota bacterium]